VLYWSVCRGTDRLDACVGYQSLTLSEPMPRCSGVESLTACCLSRHVV